MKNFKRLAIAAVIAVMAFGVTAFAANSPTTASYENDVIKLDNKDFMEAGVEYSVILTESGATVADDTILYINQGDKDAAFWTSMGPKNALDLANKNYVLKIYDLGRTDLHNIPIAEIAVTDTINASNGKKIVYAETITVNGANCNSTLSVTNTSTNVTKTSTTTLGKLVGGEWVSGSNVYATLAVGILVDTDNTDTFTVTVTAAE